MVLQERVEYNKKHISEMKKFVESHKIRCNLDNPETIQEKLMWLNIYDADSLKTDCADKLKVKEYAKIVIGKDICVPTIAVWDSADDVDFDELPDSFVLKCNHGSGMNIIVKDKSKINQRDIRNKLQKWLDKDFAFDCGFESHYHWIDRKIIAENMIGNGDGKLLDYKFWCFNGEPRIWTINDGNGHGDIMYYKMDGTEWNLYGVEHYNDYVKPLMFDKMIELSRKLSSVFKFVRVDFYEVYSRIYLGEMTFTPGAFIFKYKNPDDEIAVGNLLELDTCTTMNEEQYIVSLTSFPERIGYVSKAIESLLNQKTDVQYKIVLVLAEPQFPEKRLPDDITKLVSDNMIELLWHPTDIRSHKKLIPTLMKYQDATVIITDDDVIRTPWWLQMFIEDHRKYPNDVIVGYSAWRLGNDLKQSTATNRNQKGFTYNCVTEPNKILYTERPANGLGGVLYPKHTFKDKRFFNEDLFMELSPYSDESWQYCFNVIEDRTLRMCSCPTEWSKKIIRGTEKTALSKRNNANEYTRLYNELFKSFPEYKSKMEIRLKQFESRDIIVSDYKPEQTHKQKVICRLTGRLGNIMFQSTTARYYARKHSIPVIFYFPDGYEHDCNYFVKTKLNDLFREPLDIVSKKEAFENALPLLNTTEKSSIIYSEIPFMEDRDIHLIGDRQSEKYFTKEFAMGMFDFTKIDKEVARIYGDLSETAAIHIRRTDYVDPPRHYRSITEEDVHKIREKFPDDKFIIFSDDVEWCKEKFSGMEFRFSVKNDSGYDDAIIELAAMRKCMAVIMSNSTFSWWAAYLSRETGHMTVYKNPWFTYDSENDIIPSDKSWITFDKFLKL